VWTGTVIVGAVSGRLPRTVALTATLSREARREVPRFCPRIGGGHGTLPLAAPWASLVGLAFLVRARRSRWYSTLPCFVLERPGGDTLKLIGSLAAGWVGALRRSVRTRS